MQPLIRQNKQRFFKISRYIISGATAFGVDIVLLYFFTDIIKIYYLLSAMIAFSIAFFVSFFMQKYWTFQENSVNRIKEQMIMHFILGFVNLGVNTVFMYILVDIFKVWYIMAQGIISFLISFYSFVLYQYFIFKHKSN